MQDEYGRPLSDDGQWVWDGSAWQPTGIGGIAGVGGVAGRGPDPESEPYEPTRVGQPAGLQSGPQDYFARPGQSGPNGPGVVGPGVPRGPGGPGIPPPPPPWWKRPVVIIGALLVLLAVLVTVLLLTRSSDGDSTPSPSPSVTSTPSAAPTTPSPTPTTLAPTTPPPTTVPPTTPPPTTAAPVQVTGGLYECTQGGESTGLTISISGLTYTTNTGAVGTYKYDSTTGAISFTGGDLGPYTGTYNPSGPSMDIQASGIQLHCAL